MPSRKMRTAIYLFYGLDVEIRPIWTPPGLRTHPPELFIHPRWGNRYLIFIWHLGDKQLGWVGAEPRRVHFGRISISSPYKKLNGVPPQPPNHDWKPFNLIWAFSEWLEHDILEILDFQKMPGSIFSKTRTKWCSKKSSFVRIQIPTFSHP